MTCAVHGCDNMLCQRFSYRYGYICDRHFQQLIDLGPRVNVARFMAGSHRHPADRDQRAIERYNTEFPFIHD